MKRCDAKRFEAERKRRCEGGNLSGPFIHSAPNGNVFRGPFAERVWLCGEKTVLSMRRNGNEEAWEYRIEEGGVKS